MATLQEGGGSPRWLTEVAHAFDHHNASLSEGAPSLLWSRPCLESLMGSGLARIPRVGCDNRGGPVPSVSPRQPVRRAWRGRKWRERPPLFGRWCGAGEGKGGQGTGHPLSPLPGVALTTVIPCGKAEMGKIWTRVVLLNLALTVAGLRVWLPP